MTFFRDMSVAKKLYGLVGVLLAFLLLMGLMSISSLSSVNQKGQQMYKADALPLSDLGAASVALTDERRLVLRGIVFAHDASVQQKIDAAIAADQTAFDQHFNRYLRSGLTAREAKLAASARSALTAWLPSRDRERALSKAGNLSGAVAVNENAHKLTDTIQSSLDELTALTTAKTAKGAGGISSTYSQSRTQTIVLLVLALLVGVGVAFLVIRQLTGAVKTIIERMAAVEKAAREHLMAGLNALAVGDLTLKLEAGTQARSEFARDELGRIMRQTESMRDAIVESYGAYNMTVDTLSSLIGEVTTTAGSVDAASKEMSSTSEEAGKATGEIAQAVGEVAEGAERQVQMVEAARNSAEDVARAVGESAESAQQAAEVAHETRRVAQEGVGAAQQANDAMRSVRDSSQEVSDAIGELASKSGQIGAIVQTITGIAEQTNLLALNAAIEAARAGEQGRGFAVVAEEVRKLAEESQRAAAEISDLVGAIQQETTKAVDVVEAGAKRTADGAEVVEKTREAFQRIGTSVEDMTARIEQIAAASQQIAASATSMQENINEVAAVAQAILRLYRRGLRVDRGDLRLR